MVWSMQPAMEQQICQKSIKGLQSGKVQQYAIYFLAGVIGLAVLFTVFMAPPLAPPKGENKAAP